MHNLRIMAGIVAVSQHVSPSHGGWENSAIPRKISWVQPQVWDNFPLPLFVNPPWVCLNLDISLRPTPIFEHHIAMEGYFFGNFFPFFFGNFFPFSGGRKVRGRKEGRKEQQQQPTAPTNHRNNNQQPTTNNNQQPTTTNNNNNNHNHNHNHQPQQQPQPTNTNQPTKQPTNQATNQPTN